MEIKEIIAKFLTVLGCVLAFNPFWWIIGFPMYLLGVAMLMAFYNDKRSTIRWILYPLIAPLSGLIMLVVLCVT